MLKLLDKLLNPAPPKFNGVMGIFYFVDDAADAVTALRQAGHKDLQVFSPVPHHEIEHALEQGPSLVRFITLGGGILGATGGIALCYYSIISWPCRATSHSDARDGRRVLSRFHPACEVVGRA